MIGTYKLSIIPMEILRCIRINKCQCLKGSTCISEYEAWLGNKQKQIEIQILLIQIEISFTFSIVNRYFRFRWILKEAC